MKNCRKCLVDQPLDSFYNNAKMKDGKVSYCKPCDNRRKVRLNAQWKEADLDKHKLQKRNEKLWHRYKMTHDDYLVMLKEQKGLCKICGSPDSKTTKTSYMYVDHCHTTNKVRGLLCRGCNTGIGAFEDNTKSLLSAIKYLENK